MQYKVQNTKYKILEHWRWKLLSNYHHIVEAALRIKIRKVTK